MEVIMSAPLLSLTLTPSAGHDYTRRPDIIDALYASTDFIINDLHGEFARSDSKPINLRQLLSEHNPCRVRIRYNSLRSVAILLCERVNDQFFVTLSK